MVELFDKKTKQFVTKVVKRHQTDWDISIDIQYSDPITTGPTPAMIVFGRLLRLQSDLELGSTRRPEEEITNYVISLR